MKRTLLGLAIMGLSCNALADNLYPTGLYVGAKIGASILHPEKIKQGGTEFGSYTKGVFAGSLVGGYDFSYDYDVPVRTELDFTMRTKAKKDLDKDGTKANARTRVNTLLANVYYDFYTGTAFTPYLNAGIGVGFDKIKFEEPKTSKKKTKFAWAVGLGSSYNFSNLLSADLSVRFVDAGKIKAGDNEDSFKAIGTDILIGIRYSF